MAYQRQQLDELRAEQLVLQQQIGQDQITVEALAKKTHGVRYLEASDGHFINVPRGFEPMTCVGNVPCIRLK